MKNPDKGFIKKLNPKSSFFLLQFIMLIIAFFIVKINLFGRADTNIWSIMMQKRNAVIKNFFIDKYYKNLSKITLVGIDEDFFKKENIGYQGLHRGYYARVLENIQKQKPKIIGMDVFFEKGYQFNNYDINSQTLNKVFSSYDNFLADQINNKTALACIYEESQNQIKKPADIFLTNKPILGHVYYLSNSYRNIFFGIPPYIGSGENKLFPLSFEIFANYKMSEKNLSENKDKTYSYAYEIKDNGESISISIPGDRLYIPISDTNSKKTIFTPLYISSEKKVGNNKNINYISFYDVYRGDFDKSLIKDKIVLIGATDRISIYDIKNTLVGEMPGVLIHANEILSLLNNDFIYITNKNQNYVIIFCFLILNIFILSVFREKRNYLYIFLFLTLEIIIMLIAAGSLSIGSYIYGGNKNIFWPGYSIFLPVGTIIIIMLLHILISLIYTVFYIYGLKENIQRMFSIYTGEEVDKRFSSFKDIGKKSSEEKNITIFFSDIKGFTQICEDLNPKQSTDILNEYLEQTTNIIMTQNGVIDKYLGDGIMAFWENEISNDLAAIAAINIINAMPNINDNINKKMNIQTKEKLMTRIGLHYGKTIIGDIGSEKNRLDHTIIGDSVNLASRLESINKYYGTQICMSTDFRQNIKNKDIFITRKIDKIRVKGKENPIEIMELFPVQANNIDSYPLVVLKSFVKKFEEALEKYFEGEFEEAIVLFEEAKEIKSDKTSELLIKRCQFMKNSMDSSWDGVWAFYEK